MSPDLPEEIRSAAGDSLREATIAGLFMRQARRTPDAVALIVRDQQLTYRALDERSGQLAAHLRDLDVAPETLIGVAMERTEMLPITLLAVLKAGCAYVPLDPSYPKDRLAWIIQDSTMPLLLTTATTRGNLPPEAANCKVIEVENLADSAAHPQGVAPRVKGENLAYAIYTSGSTGKPKGVMVEHRNVMNFFAGMDLAIGSGPGTWLAVTSTSFDISVLELFWTLTRGFTVVLQREEDSVADVIERCGVTHLQMTPSLARMLTFDARAFAALGSLKQILLGGEAVPAALVRHLRQVFSGELYNMYGPTETTIWSTVGRIEDVDATVPIGRPILNTQVFLLDGEQKPVAEGDIGELYIGGDGVARGYWNRPDLTAERFVTIPSLGGSRLYRTGDLARFLPDGAIDFLGRADYQIKLRGHRIEPGEIEAELEKCAGIHRAVVVLREDREGDQRLAAYVLADAAKGATEAELRRTLGSKLPEFMVPSSFIFLRELPLTDNGKIDRKALLKMPLPSVSPAMANGSGGPTTEIERTIARLWQEALGIPSVGLHENFFDLGAHSLTVAEVHGRLQEALGREFDLVDLFQYSTVSTLAAHLGGAQADGRASDRAQRRRIAMQR